MHPAFSPEQRLAIEARGGPLFLHAGAGSGKTAVLVERFVRATSDDGARVDSILAITFTEKAAAELKLRIRRRFLEEGDRERAREAERAWVSTIHGFCSRVLRAHPLAAGLDPDYRVLDEARAERLGRQAFELALEAFVAQDDGTERLELLAAYTPDKLAGMVRTVHGRLRTQGQLEPSLPELAAPGSNADEGAASYGLLRELMPLYARRFSEAKRALSALDFEDLELLTRDLLRRRPELREHYRGRFTQVMVDEFQDTNRLQNELLQLIAEENLFTVGDERQSIYSFRGADVSVFQEHCQAAEKQGSAARLRVNFRSAPAILDVLNGAFTGVPGFERELAQPPGAPSPSAAEPAVELIVVDSGRGHWDAQVKGEDAALGTDPFGASMRSVPVWRAAEARLVAQRLAQGIGEGEFEPGEVALLARAGTDLAVYERALSERSIPTYVAGGRGYWSQQQVADLRAYLAALANPQDELALFTLLASPLVGASLDSLALLRLRSRALRRDPWWALESGLCPGGDGAEGLAEALAPTDRRRLERFARRFAEERLAAPRIALETLIDRAITHSGYDRAVLSLPAGARRMANLRKLMRLARLYEAEEGRDLRGFIDWLDSQDLAQAREGEAPLEPEHVQAVRLMTVHAAKGLEFPVVCVADLGRAGRGDDTPLRVTEDGRAGLELLSLGGERSATLDLEAIKEEEAQRAEDEERRVFYVAMTRAQRRLILSGATNTETWPQPKALGAPMEWLWRAVAPALSGDAAAAPSGESEQPECRGRRPRVRYTVCSPSSLGLVLEPAARGPITAPERAAMNGGHRPAPPPPAPPPRPRTPPVRRLSYSALESYARCAYCFYVERVLGLGEATAPISGESFSASGLDGRSSRPHDDEERSALLRGTVVHELLERLDLARPVLPHPDDIAHVIERHGGVARPADVASIAALVTAFGRSSTAARLAVAARVRRELPFAFLVSPDGRRDASLLVNGVVDVRAHEPDRTLIVDYKSDRLLGADPLAVVEQRYVTQRLVYALAALRAGAERVEVVHLFLERPSEPVAAVFDAGGAEALEGRLRERVGGIVAGRFEPAEDDGRACLRCAGRMGSWQGRIRPGRELALFDG